MERILLTGGSGFIGYYIAEELVKQGHEVVSFSPGLPRNEMAWMYQELNGPVEFFKGDVADLSSVMRAVVQRKISRIIHFGALTNQELFSTSPIEGIRVNVLGSANLFEAARIMGLPRVVNASSSAVYAPKQYEPIDEFHPVLLPDAGPALKSYSSAKVAAEAFALHYWKEYGVSIVSLRPSGVYGFGMVNPLFIKPLIENAINEIPSYVEGGDARRDMVHVRDVAQCAVKATFVEEERLKQRAFNMMHGGDTYSVFDLADAVKQVIPSAEIHVTSGMSEVEAQIDKSRGRYYIENAREQLGYEPTYEVVDGVREYIEMYLRYHQK